MFNNIQREDRYRSVCEGKGCKFATPWVASEARAKRDGTAAGMRKVTIAVTPNGRPVLFDTLCPRCLAKSGK